MDANLFYCQQKQALDALHELREHDKRKHHENKPGMIALLKVLIMSLWSSIFGWVGR
jgi:hypothetical protein